MFVSPSSYSIPPIDFSSYRLYINVVIDGQTIGKREILDHCPILLLNNKENQGPKLFRVLDYWFDNKDFVNFMEREWKSILVEERSDFEIKENFKILNARLKWWNHEVYAKVLLEVEENKVEINMIDALIGYCKEDEVEDLVVSRSKVTGDL